MATPDNQSGFGQIRAFAQRQQVHIIQVGIFVGFVLFLEYASRSGLMDVLTLTPPSKMVVALVELVQNQSLYVDFGVTLLSLSIAFFGAVVFGVPIGLVLWRTPTLHQILEPYLLSYYAIPIFVFYPLFIVLFGLGASSIILIAFLMSIVAVIVNTANGFNKVPEVYRDLGRSLNLSSEKMFRHIYLPAAAPYLFTGLKLGFIYSFIGVLATEFILSNAGLGYRINYYYNQFKVADMYAMIILVTIIALIFNFSLIYIEEQLYRSRVMNDV